MPVTLRADMHIPVRVPGDPDKKGFFGKIRAEGVEAAYQQLFAGEESRERRG